MINSVTFNMGDYFEGKNEPGLCDMLLEEPPVI